MDPIFEQLDKHEPGPTVFFVLAILLWLSMLLSFIFGVGADGKFTSDHPFDFAALALLSHACDLLSRILSRR